MKMTLNTIFLCRNKTSIFNVGQSGFAPMLVMIIIGVAALIVAINMTNMGQGDLEASLTARSGLTATSIANSCAQNILSLFQGNAYYASSSLALSINGGSCIISIESANLQKNVNILSVYEDYFKKITFRAEIASSGIEIYDWREY